MRHATQSGGAGYRIATTIRAFDEQEWDAVAGRSVPASHRWHRLMERSRRDYAPCYALLYDARGPLAAIVANRRDTFGRSGWREWLLQRATLMARMPYAMQPGIIVRAGVSAESIWPDLSRALRVMCWRMRRPLLAINDVPADEIPAWRERGYLAIDRQPPGAVLNLRWNSHRAYVESLPTRQPKELRRMRRRAEEAGLRFTVGPPSDADAAELYPLLCEVYAGHGVSPDQVPFTPELFARLVDELPGEAVLFRGYVGDRIAGFMLCIVDGDTLHAPVLGLRYELARPSYLYFVLIDEIVQWAIAHGMRTIVGGLTNYEQKRKRGFEIVPRWMCVQLQPAPLNGALQRIVPALLRLIGRGALDLAATASDAQQAAGHA